MCTSCRPCNCVHVPIIHCEHRIISLSSAVGTFSISYRLFSVMKYSSPSKKCRGKGRNLHIEPIWRALLEVLDRVVGDLAAECLDDLVARALRVLGGRHRDWRGAGRLLCTCRFVRGLLDSQPILQCISVPVPFFSLSRQSVESQRAALLLGSASAGRCKREGGCAGWPTTAAHAASISVIMRFDRARQTGLPSLAPPPHTQQASTTETPWALASAWSVA